MPLPLPSTRTTRRSGVLLGLLLAVQSLASAAEIIPAIRTVDWSPHVMVGVPGGIPTDRTSIIDVTQPPYNADKTGATDATAAISAAVAAAPEGAVVFLPAGTYGISNTIYLKNHITFRGAGMDVTRLRYQGGASRALNAGNGSMILYAMQNNPVITGGMTRGSTILTTADTSSFPVGRLMQISRHSSVDQYETPLVVGVGGYEGNFGWLYSQKTQVVAKTATTLTIFPPVYGDMSGAEVRAAPAAFDQGGLGIEDLTIDLTGSTTQFGIWLEEHIGSWVTGVRIKASSNYSLALADCLRCEVRGCYLDDLNHGGSNGAGLLMGGSSGTLVEDNIIRNSFPGMEINGGSCGNVFAYNFVVNDNGMIGIDTNHGPHNTYNLYEGNVTNTLMSDGYFGSEAYGTVYRNWITGLGTGYTASDIGYVLALKRFTRDYSVIGNILGTPGHTMTYNGVSLGGPNLGNGYSEGVAPGWKDWGVWPGASGFQELDSGVAATLIQKGNFNYYDNAIPSSEALSGDLPQSLYLSGKPAWFGNLAWPPFDAHNPGTPSYEAIPAGYRFVHGSDPQPGQDIAPTLTAQPQSRTVVAGLSATFGVTASGTPAPSYQWQKNGVAISGATAASYTTPATVAADNGATFRCVVSNRAGSVTSGSATLTVESATDPGTGSGTGTGLAATYYNNRDFSGEMAMRTDATVDFAWGRASPIYGISATTFSVRWSGQVQAQHSETYKFFVNGDDGVRLWVGGQLLIDKWKDQGATEYSGSIALVAGQKYDLVLEYYQNTGSAVAQLGWSSPSTAKQIIPTSQLFPSSEAGRWVSADVGAVGLPGVTRVLNGVVVVSGSGADIWNQADGCHFVGQPLSGDGSIVARVRSQQNTNPWAKAGVMIRESTAAGARQAFCCVTPGNGVAFQYRGASGGSSSHVAGSNGRAPRWVKLVRQGATVTGYESADGQTWTTVGSTSIALGNPVQIGLAVTSHDNSVWSTAVFESVAVTPGGSG